jgi:hypothetical protein
MSDSYYQERAKRRTRILLILGGLVVMVACIAAGVLSLMYDGCTRSFDRAPRSVISAYVNAVKLGDATTAQGCWQHQAFYELDAGCSEICLSKVWGAQYELTGLAVADEPQITSDGRANLTATVSIDCTENAGTYTGEIVLDSVKANVPWRHWTIIRSTFGGTVAEPWCK